MAALATLIDRAASELRAAGIEEPRREARLLAALALDSPGGALIADTERPVGAREATRFRDYVARRAAREPLSRIRGRREFWSLEFRLGPTTLDPRPDSETLVAAALDLLLRDRAARLLDCGTGTGCLLIAVLSERPAAAGIGIDIDPQAVAIAADNAARAGLGARAAFAVADWREPATLPAGPFDLVLAHPPYIPSSDIAGLAPEVARYDPLPALDGGADGLAAYRSLAPVLASVLAPEGYGIVELGAGQADDAVELFGAAGLATVGRQCDLAGVPRCLILRRSPQKNRLEIAARPTRLVTTRGGARQCR
jgi:release factor glutamine methyltransferase